MISLFFLMIMGGISEIILLGSFIPLIDILGNPEKILENPLLKNYTTNLDSADYISNLRLIVAFLITSILIATSIRILNNFFICKVTAGIGSDLSYECYKKTLYQPYLTHINQNTSKIIGVLTDFINGTVIALNAYLQMMTSFIISIFLLITLCSLNIKVASTVILIIIIFYTFISSFNLS